MTIGDLTILVGIFTLTFVLVTWGTQTMIDNLRKRISDLEKKVNKPWEN